MLKQTVEEAAQSRWPISDDLTPSDRYTFEMFHLLFKDGAAWQKEQGIDWIRVGNGLPIIPEDAQYVNMLITDGLKVEKCDYNRSGFQIYPKPFVITHYAYITLP